MFKIRIHCWGGLGSQMYTLALAIDALKRFPFRKICILFHTGGVTSRNLEIGALLNKFDYKIVDDFNKTSDKKIESSSSPSYSKFIKNLLLKLGFLSTANTTLEYTRLKPWVISVRGHYSHRLISYSTLDQMEEFLKPTNQNSAFEPSDKSKIALHYRLGDLLQKKRSSIVQIDRLYKLMDELTQVNIFEVIDIFSDSSHEELEELLKFLKPINIRYVRTDALNTINLLRSYDTFIGTNSKITIWAILFRLKDNNSSVNYCPINILPLLKHNIGVLDNAINLKTF